MNPCLNAHSTEHHSVRPQAPSPPLPPSCVGPQTRQGGDGDAWSRKGNSAYGPKVTVLSACAKDPSALRSSARHNEHRPLLCLFFSCYFILFFIFRFRSCQDVEASHRPGKITFAHQAIHCFALLSAFFLEARILLRHYRTCTCLHCYAHGWTVIYKT